MSSQSLRGTSVPPLRSYGADGEVVAYSYDGGNQWSQVPTSKSKKEKNVMREFKYRIAAIAPMQGSTPSWERRIVNSFAPLGDVDILAGWGPLPTLSELSENALDAIVIPFGVIANDESSEEDILAIINDMKRVGRKVFLDIDSVTSKESFNVLAAAIKAVDAVTVPSDVIAQSLRAYNANTFCIPPTINMSVWQSAHRTPGPDAKPRIAMQHLTDKHQIDAVKWMETKYGITVIEDDWENRSVYDDPKFYTNIDVVIVGASKTNANILPAMAGGVCIVGDLSYSRTLIHNHSGILVADRGPSPWRKELSHIAVDSRTRVKMQAGAKERSRLFTGKTFLNRLALPYRVILAS